MGKILLLSFTDSLNVVEKKPQRSPFWLLGFVIFCLGTLLFGLYFFYENSLFYQPFHIYLITMRNSGQFVKIKPTGKTDFSSLITKSLSKENHEKKNVSDPMCSNVPVMERYDCYPDTPVTESQCSRRGCCWHAIGIELWKNFSSNNLPPLGVPFCYYPSNYVGYKIINVTLIPNGQMVVIQRIIPSGFPKDIERVNLTITYLNENSIRLKFTDLNFKRFEVPLSQQEFHEQTFRDSMLFDVHVDDDGNLNVTRKSTDVILFSTKLSQLVYSDQFLQLSTHLPSSNLYGIGEQYDHLLRNVNWSRNTLFNRDIPPTPNKNLYGSHPFYLVVEANGECHGVVLLNSNAMDIILQPTPSVVFRTIGGILDFYVFLGPSPDQVIQQYTQIVGSTFMPPYWSLGFHLCKFGYNSLNRTRLVWQRTRNAGIPFDVQWNDIDYMDKNDDFTYDKINFKGLPEFVKEIHENGMHYVIMIDPGISNGEANGTYSPYDEGVKNDIFVKNISGDIFIGKVWNKVSTVFPDFSHPNSWAYWKNQLQDFHQQIPFDGVWIDMNEPSNFYNGQKDGCPQNSSLENPLYVPGGDPLQKKTLCMTAKHYASPHYDEHNLYSYREADVTALALRNITGKRPFLISRASITGQGVFGGHWSGDIFSSWEDLRYSIVALLNFNFFGISMMGSDICGFNGNTTEELCARWSSVGAFYPFSRNHNTKDSIDQDPVALGPTVIEAARKALLKRYSLLPYLYTLFYRSHVFGETIVRPLFFEYPNDVKTYNVEETFLWGPAFMVVPVLYPGASSVTAYFPNDLWYNFTSGKRMKSFGELHTIETPITEINLYVRGGYILPLQTPNMTTVTSRQNPFILLAVLNEKKEGSGELYWDDGESVGTYENKKYNMIEFAVKNNTLTTKPNVKGYSTLMPLSSVKICGLLFEPVTVIVNDKKSSFQYDEILDCLHIEVQKLFLLSSNTISWR